MGYTSNENGTLEQLREVFDDFCSNEVTRREESKREQDALKTEVASLREIVEELKREVLPHICAAERLERAVENENEEGSGG